MIMRIVLLHLIAILSLTGVAFSAESVWQNLDEGLDLGRFRTHEYSPYGDSLINVLRIDPQIWDLRLLSLSSAREPVTLTAKEWCARHDLIAATNAGMFHEDYATHTGYMRCGSDVNNPRSNGYKSVAAFSPRRPDLPPFRIFDLDTVTITSLREDYSCLIQNLRLIDRARKNRWSPQEKQWSEAALGEDSQGRVLFIYCRSPYSMYDLNNILLSLPIDLVCAQHLEGGPEAQLYFRTEKLELELAGSFETDFFESNANSLAWPVPNILGITKK